MANKGQAMPRTGQRHHNAKLSDRAVQAMRETYQRWKDGGENKGYEALARMYGCGVSTARDIITYRTRYRAR